jgi:ribonuclease P protein component
MFYLKDENLKFGFISSKRVGNSVKRSRSRRVLRSLVAPFCKKMGSGYWVFIAKEQILKSSHKKLTLDFNRGLNYLKR